MAVPTVGEISTQAWDGSSTSWSHICSGSNLGLVVCVTVDSDATVNSVTYAGASLTKASDRVWQGAGVPKRTTIWSKTNPATGSNTVAVTISVAEDCGATAITLRGVDQGGMLDTVNTGAQGDNNTPTSDITTVANDCLAVDSTMNGDPDITATVGAGQAQASNFVAGSGPGTYRMETSTEGKSTPGSVTMSWSLSSPDNWITVAASFKGILKKNNYSFIS